jgi:hypothetical protein
MVLLAGISVDISLILITANSITQGTWVTINSQITATNKDLQERQEISE